MTAESVLTALENAQRELINVNSSHTAVDLLNAYRKWASQQARILLASLVRESVDALLLSPGYARLLTIDSVTYGSALRETIDLEIDSATQSLTEAIDDVKQQRGAWQSWSFGLEGPPTHTVFLDTNVLLAHSRRLDEVNWHEGLRTFPHEPITLGISLVVVEELDGLKRNGTPMTFDGDKRPVKEHAREALRVLDSLFASSLSRAKLRDGHVVGNQVTSDLFATVLTESLDHRRLPINDAEIIDQALAHRPYVGRMALATGDRAMTFRARQLGVDVFRPTRQKPAESADASSASE